MRFLVSAALAALTMTSVAHARPVFSAAERAEGLTEGRGMGLAIPAENNGYPGPRHLLDAADTLGLSAGQREAVQKLFVAMRAEAIPAARRLLADEATLDRLFIEKRATLADIKTASDRASQSESELRVIHLKYHLATRSLLTPAQLTAYAGLGSHPDQVGASEHHHGAAEAPPPR
jgi:Spy/CpxP family protein refolding chaperone